MTSCEISWLETRRKQTQSEGMCSELKLVPSTKYENLTLSTEQSGLLDCKAFPTQSAFDVIYQTRETVFHQDIPKPIRELKIRRAAEYF